MGLILRLLIVVNGLGNSKKNLNVLRAEMYG